MIAVSSLKKSFGKKEVLKSVDLRIAENGIYAILGPNGSGKTTLIKSILGMVIPSGGVITVNDLNVKKNWAYRKEISYLPQIAHFPENLRVRELFRMITNIRQQPTEQVRLIHDFKLEPFLDSKLSVLSGGTKQKVNIVMALMFDCPILILDEPTSGLDPAAMIKLKAMVAEEKQKGKTIIVTSHIMQFVAEIADEIIYLLDGAIYFRGSIEKLLNQTGAENFEAAIAAIANVPHHD